MTDDSISTSSSDNTTAAAASTDSTTPSLVRGRPRSTSISSGSPNPAPGVPLPSLFPDPIPAPPQLSHSSNNNFPFSFPSNSTTASSSLSSNFGSPWGKMNNSSGPGSAGGGGGHRSSLSVPGIISPSPLAPGAVPRGGRHRRTQSVSPPGFSMNEESGTGENSNAQESRRSSEPSIPVSKAEGSLGIPISSSPRQPRLNISTSIGTRLSHQRSPSSPTRSPRAKPISSSVPSSTMSSSPTNQSHFEQQQQQSHPHLIHHSHHPQHPHHVPISSHAALLQGVRSHALPHSPTLDALPGHHHDVSPLSTSPSIPHHAGFAARRLSGGQSSSTRPLFSTTLSLSSPTFPSGSERTASPPFGPTSPSINGRLSPLPFDINRPNPTTAARDDNLRHLALDQAMTDAILDHESTSPPPAHSFHSRRRSSSGASSHSPPLLPLPFDFGTPASPRGGTRPRSGSIGRAVSSSTSPASLFLEEDQGDSSPNEMKEGSPCEVHGEEIDIARPPSPTMVTDSLFPVSGTLPPPSPPATTLSSLGFNIPSPMAADTPAPASPSISTSPVLSPVLSGLSASRPSPPLNNATSSTSLLPEDDSLPPASPHRGPISLPPPLNAPTPLPPHLIGGSAARSRSRSRSREREKERKREKSRSRSRSGSREREVKGEGDLKERPQSPGGMRLAGLEFVPKVHSPLASPPATEPRESSKMVQVEEEKEETATEEEEGDHAPTLGMVAEEATTDVTSSPSQLPPPIPPPSIDRTISSALGLPHLAIPSASSPVGTPEHLEESPTSSESYFALAPGAALARSPPPLPEHLATLPALPSLERPPSWEDELDDDDFDDIDHDGTGELGYTAGTRRKSSGTKTEEERVSLLQALGISKTDADRDKEREMAEQEAERRRVEQESQELEREERAREDERERQREFSALGFMDVDLEAQEKALGEEDDGVGLAGEAGDLSVGDVDGDTLQIDEESLSALERIFVCAKSEAVEERARVAHFLADWVPAVEICEAVEYVLPLLAGLIEDEMVKEVFAPQLDRVMWYFFSHCPLVELDSNSEKASSCAGSPVPSRYKSRSNSLVTDISPDPSVCGPSDRSATPPPTSETSPTQSHADTSSPNLPRISVTTFTALLGALLTDQSTTVAKATEAAVVRFLCRLKDKPVPLESPSECSLEFTPSSQPLVLPELSISEPDSHSSYTFTAAARQVLEDEVVSGIVIGLARLDEDDHEAEQAQPPVSQHHSGFEKTRTNEIKEDDVQDPVLFTSPEEHSLEDVDDETDEDMKFFERWTQDNGVSEFDLSAHAMPISRSPPDQVLSSFSPEQPADEEASIGKMVSMSLMGAIAAADCLDSSVLIKQFLPEVQRMKGEGMFYVRKEAVQALGNLATVVPAFELESTLLPLHTFFSQDQVWHVRRAAVLALPAICKPLSPDSLRNKAIEAIRQFSTDDNRNVRSGALEIAGELIFLFHEDPQGVPEELLSFFLGTPLDSNQPSEPPSRAFSVFRTALESPPNSFLDTSNSWQSPGFFGRDTRDSDRPILTAFNFPAVILTLGRDKWDLVKDHHLALCKDPVEKARQSLASSLHEAAKIVGTDQADACLLEPLSWFLQDAENVQTAILENVSTLLLSFGGEAARKAVGLLGDSWIDIVNWRLREQALKKIAEFGPNFMQNDGEEQVLSVLAKAFKDSVASVREQATVTVPPLLNAVLDRPTSLSKLLAFLNVYRTDSSYRNRVAYVSSIVACVRASLPRDIFELHFLDALVELARDKVVSVRIAVSRAINEACQCVALYCDPSTRSALREVLSILAVSPDRDVRLPILEFYNHSPSASREPSPSSNQASPEATKPNRYNYGVNIEESPRAERVEEDSPMTDDSNEQDDADMSEFETSLSTSDSDGVLLERPSIGEDIMTPDEEGGFVEVSRPS